MEYIEIWSRWNEEGFSLRFAFRYEKFLPERYKIDNYALDPYFLICFEN